MISFLDKESFIVVVTALTTENNRQEMRSDGQIKKRSSDVRGVVPSLCPFCGVGGRKQDIPTGGAGADDNKNCPWVGKIFRSKQKTLQPLSLLFSAVCRQSPLCPCLPVSHFCSVCFTVFFSTFHLLYPRFLCFASLPVSHYFNPINTGNAHANTLALHQRSSQSLYLIS